ncbi:hypothetical protein DHB64_15530 [Antarcticibacterium sp. W02-3]|nr:hypothetical protein [Antarcticibacterium sp. W02-3]
MQLIFPGSSVKWATKVPGIIPVGKDAPGHIQKNLPDIVLINIQLKGSQGTSKMIANHITFLFG